MGMDVKVVPKIEVDQELLNKIKTQTNEMGQVVVHCLYQDVMPWGSAIRIWPTTFLMDSDSDHQSELIHHENISLYPHWTPCDPFSKVHFTLIFSGLPKSCVRFDLEEFCDGSGGEFVVHDIERNNSDVYYLQIH